MPNWQLYGTLGCHLCHEAELLLKQAQTVADFTYETVDIIDLPESLMREWSTKIPILITPSQTLFYPFSLVDIVALTASEKKSEINQADKG